MNVEESFKMQRVSPMKLYIHNGQTCSQFFPVEEFYKQWDFVEMKGDIPVLRKRG